MLSAEEKERIRDEMLLRGDIRRELSSAGAARPTSLLTILNSPFVVTFLGALLISVMGLIAKSWVDRQQVELARQRELQDAKLELIGTFVQDFESTNMLEGQIRRAQREVAGLEDKLGSPAKHGKGKTTELRNRLKQARTELGELRHRHQEARRQDAGFAQVEALFGTEVGSQAKKLRDSRQALMNIVDAWDEARLEKPKEPTDAKFKKSMAKFESDFWERKDLTDAAFDELVRLMGREVKDPISTSDSRSAEPTQAGEARRSTKVTRP
jgi:hypothetical protein